MSQTATEIEVKNDVLTAQNRKDSPLYITAKDDDLQDPSQNLSRNPSDSNHESGTEDGENVAAIVTKAKRAATFLWTLLHAQVCNVGADQCPHQGCSEAKHILLHIKTCPTTSDFACPTSHKGCQQARKLLCHYRKCKELRIRQRRQKLAPNNMCLICTLLARHDKTISNSLSIPSPKPPTPQKKRTEQSHSLSSSFDKIYSPQVNRRKARSKSVQFDLNRESKIVDMPPPPPRPRTASVDSLPTLHQTASILRALPFAGKDRLRPRAGSLDEKTRLTDTYENDPTVELELRSKPSGNCTELKQVKRQLPFRKRSVSCSVLPRQNSSVACDTIMEE